MSDNIFSSEEMQLVTFTLGKESFGIDIMNVQEIIRTPSITVIPQAPAYVEGVTNLRGNILPVIDTRIKFGMQSSGDGVSSRVIVVDVGGRTVGLSVDAVSEVLRVEANRIEPAPSMVSGETGAGAIAGMVKVDEDKKVVMILDAASLCRIDRASDSTAAFRKSGKTRVTRTDDRKIEEAQLVSFLLGKEEFALEIEYVREIIRYPEIVKVPNVPGYIKGVISLRDRLLPIVDMRVKLDTGNDTITDNTRVVVIDVDNVQVGLVVDKVNEVARVSRDTIFPPPQTIVGEAREQLKGIVRLEEGRRIMMLIEPRTTISNEVLQDISFEQAENRSSQDTEDFSDSTNEEQMVVFKLAGEQYGLRITQVQEINRLSQITKVPRAPRFVEGVVNLRGDVIPVIDLRKRFEIEQKDYTEFTRIIVSDINARKIGIIVDEVMEVLRIPRNLLEEAPDILQGNQAYSFMDGIANLGSRMIMLLDLRNILVEKEWQKVAEMNTSTPTAKKETPVKLKKQGREQ